jgi:hypothetical protein
MPPVEVIGVGSVKIVKDGNEVSARRLYQEVVVLCEAQDYVKLGPPPL